MTILAATHGHAQPCSSGYSEGRGWRLAKSAWESLGPGRAPKLDLVLFLGRMKHEHGRAEGGRIYKFGEVFGAWLRREIWALHKT